MAEMTVKDALTKIESKVDSELERHADRVDRIEAALDARVSGERRRKSADPEAGGFYSTEGLLTKSQSFAESIGTKDTAPEERGAERVGAILHAMATKDTSHLSDAEAKAVSGVSGPDGGVLIAEAVSSSVIDLVRARSRAIEAGTQTLPMDSRYHLIPKVTEGSEPAWRSENSPISETDPTIGHVRLEAHSLASITRVSWELIEDATPDSWAMIVSDLTAAMAQKIDFAVLAGSGAGNEPLGIVNTDLVNSIDAVGTPADFDDVLDAMAEIEAANHTPGAWLLNSRDQRTYRGLKTGISGDKTPLSMPADVAALRRLVTNQLPVDGEGESRMLVGDFTQAIIGVRPSLNVRIIKLDELFAETGQVGVIAWFRGDVAVRYPEAFTVLNGVTAT